MRRALTSFVNAMIKSERFDEDEGSYHFGDGIKCGICTNGASKIAEAFQGDVWGFSQDDNPTACIGRKICFGHDFAIIKMRWLVDYWGYRYAQEIPRAVLDLSSPRDAEILRHMYGVPECWTGVASFSLRASVSEDRLSVVGQKGFIRLRNLLGKPKQLSFK